MTPTPNIEYSGVSNVIQSMLQLSKLVSLGYSWGRGFRFHWLRGARCRPGREPLLQPVHLRPDAPGADELYSRYKYSVCSGCSCIYCIICFSINTFRLDVFNVSTCQIHTQLSLFTALTISKQTVMKMILYISTLSGTW